jgi:hypothetical protein
MPNKEFLEEAPLYKEYSMDVPYTFERLEKIPINMPCKRCASSQTFVMTNQYWEPGETASSAIDRRVIRLVYMCMHCRNSQRHFFVFMDAGAKTLTKVGQYPPWDISGDKKLEGRLGEHVRYYRRGLICESQGYGIGAFSYYRRIVEEIIDELLDDVSALLTGQDLTKYAAALEETKKTRVAQDKIALVKDLLPTILRPNGTNPLDTLHSLLSDGMHARSDYECLEDAETCRTILLFLVSHIAAHKDSAKEFTASMQKLLDKRSQRSN